MPISILDLFTIHTVNAAGHNLCDPLDGIGLLLWSYNYVFPFLAVISVIKQHIK